MNNYYLIAFDSEPKIIELTIDGYKTTSSSIQNIDKITSKYSMDKIKKHLMDVGKISSMDVEVLVVHQSKYNGEARIKTFPVLTYNDYLIPLNKVKVDDVSKLIITFFNKIKKDEFKDFVEYYYTDLNPHAIRNFQRIYATIFNDPSVRDEYVEYKDVRSLLSIIIHYDRFKDIKLYQDYLFKINRYTIDNKEKLIEMTDSNTIQGQMSFSFENNEVKYHNMSEVIDELNLTNEDEYVDYYELYDRLSSEPWDDPYFKECLDKNTFPENAYQVMTLNDKVRAGMITPLDFKKEMIKRSEKRK